MRTFFLLLLLLNLGFFAWGQFGPNYVSGEAQLIDQQLNPKAIRLLTAEQVAALSAERAERAERAKAPKLTPCLELGAFNPGDLPRVEQALGALALGPKLSQRRVDEIANFWVYMPPQTNRQTATRKAAELKKLGVEEFFVVQDDPKFRFAISLGVFKSEEAAKAQLEQLRAKGVRTARVGARETQVPKVYFTVRDVSEALAAKLNDLRQGFPGSDLKGCQPEGEK
ncbi:MAG: SPOR domain-containing protein [Burkholderiales bacterium]